MLHFSFGLAWLTLAVCVLWAKEALQARGQNVGMLAAFAGMLALYNFLRCGAAWFIRRRKKAEPACEAPACPKCGRSMKLVDLGPDVLADKERWKFVCCGYQLQIENDEERRRFVKMLKG